VSKRKSRKGKRRDGARRAEPAAAANAQGTWLFGRGVDLFIGAGVGYLLSIPPLIFIGAEMGMESWPVAFALLFALFVSGPHYGATILRVYEERENRRRYAFFAVWVTLALCGLFVFGLHDVFVGSLLVTLYGSWSPWHFSGQNYGLAVMFLRRRGVPLDSRTKQLLHASFVLSFLLSFLVLHGETSAISYATIPVGEGSAFRFLSLGISNDVLGFVVPATALAYIACLVGAAVPLLRVARPSDLAPVASLVAVQALWFTLPAALPLTAGFELYGLAFTVAWISAAHGVQYLWVNYYYARGEEPGLKLGPYLGRALLAGSTVTIFPALIFAPNLLGTVPWDNGLAILLVSVVNLHHFILDGAIWKLRDGRVARLLLKDSVSSAADAITRGRPSAWFRPAIALLGVVSLAVALFDGWMREARINRAGDDMQQIIDASRSLGWIGRDSPIVHAQVAANLAVQGETEAAIAEFEHSIALYPMASAWADLGSTYAAQGRWQEAAHAWEAALALNPDDDELRSNLAQLEASLSGTR
jgi:tetratricopeptide (TPR) repeat protein